MLSVLPTAGLVILIFVVGFPAFWYAIVFLISRMGAWAALAQHYSTSNSLPEPKRSWRTMSFRKSFIRMANYGNVVTYRVDQDALYLSIMFMFRPGHPALRIPFADIEMKKDVGYFGRQAHVTIAREPDWRVIMQMSDIHWIEEQQAEKTKAQ